MRVEDALSIVYELAAQNALDPDYVDEELLEQAFLQRTALDVVHDFIVNVVSEGRL